MEINGRINIYIQGLGSGSSLWASASIDDIQHWDWTLRPCLTKNVAKKKEQRESKRARVVRYVRKHDYVDPCWASASCITAFLRRSGTK